MEKSRKHIDSANRILRLSPEQFKDPASVIAEFFVNYHLKDIREILWQWVWVGVANSNGHFDSDLERSNLLFFYENLEKLIEANYLQKRRNERRRRKGKKKSAPQGHHAQELQTASVQ